MKFPLEMVPFLGRHVAFRGGTPWKFNIDTFVKRYLLSNLLISDLHVKFQGKEKRPLKKTQHFFHVTRSFLQKTNPPFTITYTLPPTEVPPYIHPENDRPQTPWPSSSCDQITTVWSQLLQASPCFFRPRRLCIKCLEGLTTTVRYHSHEGHLLRLMNN